MHYLIKFSQHVYKQLPPLIFTHKEMRFRDYTTSLRLLNWESQRDLNQRLSVSRVEASPAERSDCSQLI